MLESKDIFGFDAVRAKDEPDDNMLSRPIRMFNVELMMEYLTKKTINDLEPYMPFMNEIRWGNQPGAIKLEVDTGYTFYIKRLAMDRQGNPRWVTRRMFQLNRQGYGGLEDAVAQEVFEHLVNYSESNIEAPVEEYKDLENLVNHIYNKCKRTSKNIFIPEGIKKMSDYVYIIKMGVRGHGLQEMDQMRTEQNQTMVSYDPHQGTIRITNYNISSPVGGPHEWQIGTNDLDVYFLPTQNREEISEAISVHMKYY